MTTINLSFSPLRNSKENARYQATPQRIKRSTKQTSAHGKKATDGNIAEQARRYKKEGHSLAEFTSEIILQLTQSNHIRTSETYRTTLRCFDRFKQGVMLEEIDSNMMISFEAWMLNRGLTKNTTSFYMRILRAIHNRAIECGLIEYSRPFRHVYTGIDKTVKRAISINSIRELKSLDLTDNPSLALARDIFLFSFYTRGMSFVDIAYLRKRDLTGNLLKYRRRKTDQLLVIGWERCMQEIINRYDTTASPYLLPIITKSGNERMQYLLAAHRINRNLKIIGKMINLSTSLTMYVARHSWASIARDKNIPLSIISESMGHESEMTTRIYLSTIDHHEIDRANRIILQSI